MRSSVPVTKALSTSTSTTASAMVPMFSPIVARSIDMPTVIRNTPSAKPLNGSMIASTSAWYSVSAISSPAISAPTMGDRPVAPVARLAPMTTSNDAARNSSGLLVRAACANSGGSSRRPSTSSATTTSPPSNSVSTRFPSPSACA